jgi:hypothetical protein
MSLPLLPLIIEAAPLILGVLGLGISLKSLRNRLVAEDALVKEIENNKEDIEKEYVQYLQAKTDEERLVELDEIHHRIKILVEHMSKENSNLIASALFQSSVKGRNSYLKKLLNDAKITMVETANKQKQPDV